MLRNIRWLLFGGYKNPLAKFKQPLPATVHFCCLADDFSSCMRFTERIKFFLFRKYRKSITEQIKIPLNIFEDPYNDNNTLLISVISLHHSNILFLPNLTLKSLSKSLSRNR